MLIVIAKKIKIKNKIYKILRWKNEDIFIIDKVGYVNKLLYKTY